MYLIIHSESEPDRLVAETLCLYVGIQLRRDDHDFDHLNSILIRRANGSIVDMSKKFRNTFVYPIHLLKYKYRRCGSCDMLMSVKYGCAKPTMAQASCLDRMHAIFNNW
jgi:hypothetical protein